MPTPCLKTNSPPINSPFSIFNVDIFFAKISNEKEYGENQYSPDVLIRKRKTHKLRIVYWTIPVYRRKDKPAHRLKK